MEGKDLLRSIATFQKELLRKRKEREQKKSTKEGIAQEARGLCCVPLSAQGMETEPWVLAVTLRGSPCPGPAGVWGKVRTG